MKVKNPAGRLDYLVAQLIDEAVRRARNPIIKQVYAEAKPIVERTLTAKIGPRTRQGKNLVRHLFTMRELAQRAQQRGIRA